MADSQKEFLKKIVAITTIGKFYLHAYHTCNEISFYYFYIYNPFYSCCIGAKSKNFVGFRAK